MISKIGQLIFRQVSVRVQAENRKPTEILKFEILSGQCYQRSAHLCWDFCSKLCTHQFSKAFYSQVARFVEALESSSKTAEAAQSAERREGVVGESASPWGSPSPMTHGCRNRTSWVPSSDCNSSEVSRLQSFPPGSLSEYYSLAGPPS